MSSAVLRVVRALSVTALAVVAPTQLRADPPKLPVPATDQSAVALRGYFYVGGKYVGEPGKEIMQGQMYVEVLAPKDVRRPYPLVLMHGSAQTATNWMGTPDGRKGWAEYFVEQGYVVYMIDQPMRARSAWHPGDGPTIMYSPEVISRLFTAVEVFGTWPQAKKHTQWPGDGPNKGQKGDKVFDAFYATQVESLASEEVTQKRNQDAGAALLDKIGPAVLLTHSQAGPFGWLIADARPQLVKGIIAIEPAGPPFENTIIATGRTRPWGLTDILITYDPPVSNPNQIAIEREKEPYSPGAFLCWMQKEPARQLVNLKDIPVVVVVAEASYHQVYDICTAKYLVQARVLNTGYMALQGNDIFGNAHMMMLEKNNLDIADRLDRWIQNTVRH